MATLRVTVLYPSAALPASDANAKRMFVFAGTGSSANGTGAFGNLGPRGEDPGRDGAYNLRNPHVAGSISVTPYAPVFFDSHDFQNDQNLAGQMAYAIEQDYIEVVDMAAPGVPLDRDDLMNYV